MMRKWPNNACATEIENPVSGCFRPLSCQECLAIDGCYVDASGYCGNITQARGVPRYNDTLYTRALALNLSLPAAKDDPRLKERQDWSFEATKATYCPDDDAVCNQCIAQQFWSPFASMRDGLDGRFCVGANGCVCISSCYHAESWCEKLFRENPPPKTTTPSPTPLPTPSSESSLVTVATLPTDDDCRYSSPLETVTDAGYCKSLRSCSDCLLKKGCRISGYGYCERDDGTSSFRDYHVGINDSLVVMNVSGRANSSDLAAFQYWQFSSSNATYCSELDTVCRQCTQQNFWWSDSFAADSRFCVGADGCVCVANCARVGGSTSCSRIPVQNGTAVDNWVYALGVIGGFVILILIASVAFKRRRLRESSPPREAISGTSAFSVIVTPTVQGPQPPTPQGSVPPLSLQPVQPQPSEPTSRETSTHRPAGAPLELYGWISHRQHLIDEETRRLNGADDFVPARNHLQSFPQ